MTVTFGQQIRARREALSLTLQAAAYRTHIPVECIRRLENEDFLSFGSLAYARSFVRTYSRFLDVDASLVDEQLKWAELARRRAPQLPTDNMDLRRARPGRRRMVMPAMAVLSLLVLCGGFALEALAQKAQRGSPLKRYPIVDTTVISRDADAAAPSAADSSPRRS